jgi:hypothetical protein
VNRIKEFSRSLEIMDAIHIACTCISVVGANNVSLRDVLTGTYMYNTFTFIAADLYYVMIVFRALRTCLRHVCCMCTFLRHCMD